MEKKEMLYEGKAKKVYRTDDAAYYIVSYKDDATAFNGQKRGSIAGKGAINNRMSNLLFGVLAKAGVPNHFVRQLNDRETVVKKVTILPLEVIVRNIAAGSFSKRFGVEEGTRLKHPTLEYCLKDDALGDPMIDASHITALGLATPEQLDRLAAMTKRVNEILRAYFAAAGITLVDFKIEFGVTDDGQVLLADEISPDTCRLWDAETGQKLDKDRFRRDLGGVEEAYNEVAARIGL